MPVCVALLLWLCPTGGDGADDPIEVLPFHSGVIPEYLSTEEMEEAKERVEEMFYHAFESYLESGFPHDEVLPLTCKGSDSMGGFALTLLDSLDTLLVMNNTAEYATHARWLIDNLNFDSDVEVVTFEANIRMVGSLIANHLACNEPLLHPLEDYNGEFLRLARDLADRLMPAFNTPTGLPRNKVHLQGEQVATYRPWTSVADAGTYLLEFGVLSNLTGDPTYIDAAMGAVKYIFDHRSEKNLVGTNIDVENGEWVLETAGIGSGIDSYYEYLLKYSILFDDKETKKMFRKLYKGVKKHLKTESLYYTANMHTGQIGAPYVDALQPFWPGLQTMINDTKQTIEAAETMQVLMGIWQHFGFFPEILDAPREYLVDARYQLRPEVAESLYHLHKTTGDPLWALLALDIVESIDTICKVPCGFASVKHVRRQTLNDQMESFFLAETLKYLFLIFKGGPYYGVDLDRVVVLNTEAHALWLE